jgi:hypothetical protein
MRVRKLYKLEKSILLPNGSNGNRYHALRKYPWFEMKPGESFFVPKKTPGALRQAASKFIKDNPKLKLVFASEGNGVRCWRAE